MISEDCTKLIEDFVFTQPRTVQEIARHIKRNWKTAERYVLSIAESRGTIAVKQIRGGTQACVKLVYWNNFSKTPELIKSNLLEIIMRGERKDDFSAFDIFQLTDKKSRRSEKYFSDFLVRIDECMSSLINNAEKEILFFSGNMSWVNYQKAPKAFEKAISRGVSVKIVTRLDLATLFNYKKLEKFAAAGKISLKHREQPLRGMLIDDKVVQLHEIKEKEKYKPNEMTTTTHFDYFITDGDWLCFLKKIFFTMYNAAPDTNVRLEALKEL